MKEKKELGQEAIYDARTLGTPRMLILGLQHLCAMFGATVVVPIIVSGFGLPMTVQTTLLMAGLGTLLFHVLTKFKVPAFLGSSFAYLGGFGAIATLPVYDGLDPELKLAYALGGVVVAGLLYLVLALMFKLVGAKKVIRWFPPIVTGPIIILVGLHLAGSAVDNAKQNWGLALVAILIVIVVNIWGKGMLKIIPILLGVVGACVVAAVTGNMEFSAVQAADLVGLQKFTIAKFDLSAILVMAPLAIAAMMEHIGDISAISSTVGDNFIEDPGLHRTLMGDGLATALAGFFGGPPNTTYGENTGVLDKGGKLLNLLVHGIGDLAAAAEKGKFNIIIGNGPLAFSGGTCCIGLAQEVRQIHIEKIRNALQSFQIRLPLAPFIHVDAAFGNADLF